MLLLKGQSAEWNERRYICGTVATRSGQWTVGRFHGMLYLSAKHSRSLIWWENTIWEAVRSTIQRPSYSAWSNGRVSHHFLRKTYRGYINLVQKSCQVYSLGYALHAEGIWKGDILIADNEELAQMDASEIHARRLTAKDALTPMKGSNFILPVAEMEQLKPLEEIDVWDHPL